jgi:hypothetical protein
MLFYRCAGLADVRLRHTPSIKTLPLRLLCSKRPATGQMERGNQSFSVYIGCAHWIATQQHVAPAWLPCLSAFPFFSCCVAFEPALVELGIWLDSGSGYLTRSLACRLTCRALGKPLSWTARASCATSAACVMICWYCYRVLQFLLETAGLPADTYVCRPIRTQADDWQHTMQGAVWCCLCSSQSHRQNKRARFCRKVLHAVHSSPLGKWFTRWPFWRPNCISGPAMVINACSGRDLLVALLNHLQSWVVRIRAAGLSCCIADGGFSSRLSPAVSSTSSVQTSASLASTVCS